MKDSVRPHIIPVLDVFEFDDFYCQVHEWTSDQDLEKHPSIADSNPIGDKPIVEIASKLLQSIAAIHAVGVVHTDLKPANIMVKSDLSDSSSIRIADFDWSLIEGQAHPWEGSVRGTPFYMSYEHFTRAAPTSKSDMFTCGIILYELYTGANPMRKVLPAGDYSLGEINSQLKSKVDAHSDFPKPSELNPKASISPAIDKLLHACLSPHPAKRPSAAEALQSLTQRETKLVLRHANGVELRTSKAEVEAQKCYLGRERCRLFDNYKEISRIHAWLMPSKDYTRWFAVPAKRKATNILTIESGGREVDFGSSPIELKTGDKVRIRGLNNRDYIVCEWTVDLAPV